MEKNAIDYAKRLLVTRFEKFSVDINDFFDPSLPLEDYFRVLFEASFNVPRTIGALLDLCYRDRVAKDEKITLQAIRLAARKHYESVQLAYFDTYSKFALEPFENKLDRSNQKSLLDLVASEARQVRKSIQDGTVGGDYFKGLSTPPVSHFIVSRALESMLVSLEANFFISRYKYTRDKNGKDVIVFALSYGLVEASRLSWGYPPGREYRNYFVQRCFDYSKAIENFLASKQTIRCDSCGASYPLEKRDSFELYKWQCPECRSGTCRIVYIAGDLAPEILAVKEEQRLPPIELEIIVTLGQEDRPMRAGEIGSLIDAAHQLVGHRTSKLRDLGLVDKGPDDEGRQRSTLTQRARELYMA
jgi:DNA-binding transcriptional ArsR family regulator